MSNKPQKQATAEAARCNLHHQYLPELLVNVCSYCLIVKSVSCCSVRGSWLFSLTSYKHGKICWVNFCSSQEHNQDFPLNIQLQIYIIYSICKYSQHRQITSIIEQQFSVTVHLIYPPVLKMTHTLSLHIQCKGHDTDNSLENSVVLVTKTQTKNTSSILFYFQLTNTKTKTKNKSVPLLKLKVN